MTRSIHKLLVANRGEIAVRILRAAQALGIPTVAACSEADVDSLAARMADEMQVIGPARADRSYLNADALLQAARASGGIARCLLRCGKDRAPERAIRPGLARRRGVTRPARRP